MHAALLIPLQVLCSLLCRWHTVCWFGVGQASGFNGRRTHALWRIPCQPLSRLPCQVLYFMPAMREAFLAAVPDPDSPYSLADELGLLFRMLAAGGPAA